jgi:hypothetical protein
MPKTTTVDKAPFNGNSLCHYPGWYGQDEVTEWRPNEPFTKMLHLIEMQRGRSAAYFIWYDEDNNRYPMFMSDMFDLVKHGEIKNGRVFARWIVKKRGQNYGVGLFKDELPRTK